MRQKLISVLVAGMLSLAALPGLGNPAPGPAASFSRVDVGVAKASGVSPDVLRLALDAVSCAASSGDIKPPRTLTLIDYSLPSVEPRLWVFDLNSGEILFKELVAHGRHTGENLATRFSDQMNSHQSSLGMFDEEAREQAIVSRPVGAGAGGYSSQCLDLGITTVN